MKWSDNDIVELINLFNKDNNYLIIANKLKRSEQSIKIKLNKLGFFIRNKNRFVIEKVCKYCHKKFNSFVSEERKFCSSSCSTIYNNKIRIRKTKTKKESLNNEKRRVTYHLKKDKKCLNCDNITSNKYCNSKCQQEYRRKIIYNKIENNEGSINHKDYKKYLIKKFGDKCMDCGWNKVNPVSGKVPIELEHIDGNSNNNNLKNLKLLCPSCHSLTPTYKALNKGNGRFKRMVRYKDGKSY